MSYGVNVELNSYGQGDKIMRPVVGASRAMPHDVQEIADSLAYELIVEIYSCYGKNSRIPIGPRTFSSANSTAPGDLLPDRVLDRRSLVQVSDAPRHQARVDESHYEESIMESNFYPEFDHHISPGS